MSKFYVTTPIYYVNDVPHIGHAYTTIAADVLARYHRMLGDEVFFLTGTDEHGQKIEEAAKGNDETPIQLADRVVERFKSLWKELCISHDDFIRTTEARHRKVVQDFFKTVQHEGDIKLGSYEDWYCTPCESFWTTGQLVDGKCPECNREVKKLKEASYIFNLSKYGQELLKYYDTHKDFIQPESRHNEVRNFVAQGLKDLSISRTSFQWGIPVPGDEKHVIYVWFDALLNYISAGEKYWPADVHLVGKDILRFHSVYWPAFLLSGKKALPKKIFAHGWWTVDGKKMSKSLGNVVDPFAMVKQYGADAFRYFLLREVPFGQDGNFSVKALEQRINSDLANDIGNLLSRSISMNLKYFGNHVPEPSSSASEATLLKTKAADLSVEVFEDPYENLHFQEILMIIWGVIGQANRFIDASKPWDLAKDLASNGEKLAVIFNQLMESLRLITLAIYPFMPQKAEVMWEALGFRSPLSAIKNLQEQLQWGPFPAANEIKQPPHLFPRLDTKSK